MRSLITLTIGVLLSIAYGAAQNLSDCSVRVHVYDNAGHPSDGVLVSLRMDVGGSAMTAASTHGVVEFCDLGWGT